MAHIVIEMDRGFGWEVRSEGNADWTAAAVAEHLPNYAIQYPHRAIVDGVVVAACQPAKRRRAAR